MASSNSSYYMSGSNAIATTMIEPYLSSKSLFIINVASHAPSKITELNYFPWKA